MFKMTPIYINISIIYLRIYNIEAFCDRSDRIFLLIWIFHDINVHHFSFSRAR